MSGSDQPKRAESHLKPRVLSHGTVECHDLDAAWERACAEKDAYGIRKITRPVDQHGTYSFYVIDADGNWWEILTNPPGGYGYVFETDESDEKWRDQNQGRDRRADWERRAGDA